MQPQLLHSRYENPIGNTVRHSPRRHDTQLLIVLMEMMARRFALVHIQLNIGLSLCPTSAPKRGGGRLHYSF